MSEITKCQCCGREIIPNRITQKYCSNNCRTRAFRARAKLPTTSEKAIALIKSIGEKHQLIEK